MSITQKPFGTAPNGQPVTMYTMTNAGGSSVSVIVLPSRTPLCTRIW